MNKIEEAITQWWGERCPETFPGCPCCDAWIEYDAMMKREPIIERLVQGLDKIQDGKYGLAAAIARTTLQAVRKMGETK